MRYKTLLIGRNNSMIDDFFNQTEDMFEVMTSSDRKSTRLNSSHI